MSDAIDEPPKDTVKESNLTESDLRSLQEVADAIRGDPARGMVAFRVRSAWESRFRSHAQVTSWSYGGGERHHEFTLVADQPDEFGGNDTAPNPLELLLAAVNACLIVGYALEAALRGITIESLEIESTGEFDLRGLLGVCEDVRPGYESINYVVRIKGSATEAQFKEMHHTAQSRSPVCFNVTRPTRLNGRIEVME